MDCLYNYDIKDIGNCAMFRKERVGLPSYGSQMCLLNKFVSSLKKLSIKCLLSWESHPPSLSSSMLCMCRHDCMRIVHYLRETIRG